MDEDGFIFNADPYVYLKAESHDHKTYFKLKGTTNPRKLLESLSRRVPRERHHCGAINCDLVIKGFINIRGKPKYRQYDFALVAIAEEDNLREGIRTIFETDYKRLKEYLEEVEKEEMLKRKADSH